MATLNRRAAQKAGSPGRTLLLMLSVLAYPGLAVGGTPPAFPGAEGFGAGTVGGRGGRVIYVTTLAPDPGGVIAGSLNHALRQSGPRHVLFKVSGVIHAPAIVVNGDVTLAFQTSPGGIIVRGLICDGHFDQNDCSGLIVRHLRSRPALHRAVPPGGEALDDALRLDGISDFILDRSSLAHATDEVAQVSWASNVTIQNTLMAETVGEHATYGGMLLNYSHPDHPQDALSIHHNLWFRLGGRLPEISCEASNYPDLPGGLIADCQNRRLRLELASNLHFDPGIDIQYNRWVDAEPANGPYRLDLNLAHNFVIGRAGHGNALISISTLHEAQNALWFSGNRMQAWPDWTDYQLAYCCNDFDQGGPNTDLGVAQRLPARHPFPAISYTPALDLQAVLPSRIGAFPHDPMDRRILAKLRSGVPSLTSRAVPEAEDAFDLDFDPAKPPPAPADTDADGMPDAFELAHAALGLDPDVPQANGSELSLPLTGVAGYDNVEVYFNLLSDLRVQQNDFVFVDGFDSAP